MLRDYLDVDRVGNGYILTVKHTVNKKNEPVETIQQVKHLGPVDHWSVCVEYKDIDLWSRAVESGDFHKLVERY